MSFPPIVCSSDVYALCQQVIAAQPMRRMQKHVLGGSGQRSAVQSSTRQSLLKKLGITSQPAAKPLAVTRGQRRAAPPASRSNGGQRPQQAPFKLLQRLAAHPRR